MASRETENNAYAKFWAGKQRALWYVMVFSGVANGMDHFGLVRPEFEGAWSTLTGLVILVGWNEMSLSI